MVILSLMGDIRHEALVVEEVELLALWPLVAQPPPPVKRPFTLPRSTPLSPLQSVLVLPVGEEESWRLACLVPTVPSG